MTNEAVSNHGEPKHVCLVELFPNEPDVWKALADAFKNGLRQEPVEFFRQELLAEMLLLAGFMIARQDDDTWKFSAEEIENLARCVELVTDRYVLVVDEAGEGIAIERVAAYNNCAGLLTNSGVYSLQQRMFVVKGYVKVANKKEYFRLSLTLGDLDSSPNPAPLPKEIFPIGPVGSPFESFRNSY